MRILVAEDDAVLAEGVMQTLRQSGYAVDRVQNGAEADSALAANQFDLLILDLGLPKRSGLDVLRRLRATDSRVPVLLLTALHGVSDRVRGLDAGAADYLAKPFDPAELEARVRALTRRGMAGCPTLLQHGAPPYDPVGRSARPLGTPLRVSQRAPHGHAARAFRARALLARGIPAARRAACLQGPARVASVRMGRRGVAERDRGLRASPAQ